MSSDFDRKYEEFMKALRLALSDFSIRDDGTGDDIEFRRIYAHGRDGKEHFICHVRPVKTKNILDVMVGLTERHLKVPVGCPPLLFRDKSVKNYRTIRVPVDDMLACEGAIHLAVQVAKYHST